MKNRHSFYLLASIIFGLLFMNSIQAQTPEKISYQAVIRNSSNNLVVNGIVGIKISILQNNSSGTVVYEETQTTTTNENGLLSLEIGNGAVLTGIFSNINWNNGPYFIKTETDPTGGTNYSITGTSELLSVPYALYAKASGSSIPGPQGLQGAAGNDGLSAHQIAVNNGFVGTESQWLASLVGPQGPQGIQGATGATGATGAQGLQGIQGLTGPQGPAGTNGTAILNGNINPTNSIGVNGDFYINTTTNTLFGPKASGAWPTGISLVGPQGATGAQGPIGATGPQGNGFSNGTVQNQILYWNGTNWITLNPGSQGQVLAICNGALTWALGGVCPTATVTNAITNKIWMDRNLGAAQVATSVDDAASYGHLYQWGRGSDGHQLRTSSTTTTKSITDQPGNAQFITTSTSSEDWRTTNNNNLWQGVNGINNPCPSGFRLPTESELGAEAASWSSSNAAGAFASPLKFPTAGFRNNSGQIFNTGSGGLSIYWTSTISGVNARHLSISSVDFNLLTSARVFGYSVRCIKD